MTEIHAHVVATALLRKGFVKVEASHHTMFWRQCSDGWTQMNAWPASGKRWEI